MIRSIFALLTQRQLCLIAVGPFNYGDLWKVSRAAASTSFKVSSYVVPISVL
jgi:hypothetical protein